MANKRVDGGARRRAPEALAEAPGTLPRSDREMAGALALYVSGPHGGSCHLLPATGRVTLGRGHGCAIVLDDPAASRTHAALEVGDTVLLADLGSANGTFVGAERLAPATTRRLGAAEAFFIGDLALVVRGSGLRPLPAERRVTIAQLPDRLLTSDAGRDPGELFALVRARASDRVDSTWLEAVLGDLVAVTERGLLVLGGGGHLALVVPGGREDEAAALERGARERLERWGLAADLESTFARGRDPSVAFVAGQARRETVRLRRGTVILRDAAMDEVRRTIERVAPAPVNVLILGETGVGKDVVASMLHELSPRRDGPFVRFNCATVPATLHESELFGYERGAFTDAVRAKAGLLESAEGGTVFLDEIGELPLGLQAKLLTTIESREVTRLGALRPRSIDVRFVAATNRNMDQAVAAGHFRLDLYYRLNLVTLVVPALRDRPADIEPLARQFLTEAQARFGLPEATFSPAAIAALQSRSWPGNIRELRNVVERAVLLAGESVLEPHHLFAGTAGRPGLALVPPAMSSAGDVSPPPSDDEALDAAAERAEIEAALQRCAGNQRRAAEQLGVSRRTLVRKIRRLGLLRPRALEGRTRVGSRPSGEG